MTVKTFAYTKGDLFHNYNEEIHDWIDKTITKWDPKLRKGIIKKHVAVIVLVKEL